MIGHSVKTGELDDSGEEKIYRIVTVDNKDGELSVQAQEFIGVTDGLKNTETGEIAKYDANGIIYDGSEATDYRVSLNADGRFNYTEDGTIMLLDTDNNVVTDEAITAKYTYGGYSLNYTDDTIAIPLSSITAVS